jgi:hypothetical protein
VSDNLEHLEMGLRSFSPEPRCPKCDSSAIQTHWHPAVVMMAVPMEPCERWVQEALLTGQVGEHLCRFCHTCRYGWPEQTADA